MFPFVQIMYVFSTNIAPGRRKDFNILVVHVTEVEGYLFTLGLTEIYMYDCPVAWTLLLIGLTEIYDCLVVWTLLLVICYKI